MTENRKPIILTAVVGGVVVLLYLSGVAFGGGDRPADASWRDTLGRFDATAPLTAADLELASGSCTVSDDAVVVPSRCALRVPVFGGTLRLGPVSKKTTAVFVTPGASLTVRLDIEGTAVTQEVERDDPFDLSFGRSGGGLDLLCAGLEPCVLELSP